MSRQAIFGSLVMAWGQRYWQPGLSPDHSVMSHSGIDWRRGPSLQLELVTVNKVETIVSLNG